MPPSLTVEGRVVKRMIGGRNPRACLCAVERRPHGARVLASSQTQGRGTGRAGASIDAVRAIAVFRPPLAIACLFVERQLVANERPGSEREDAGLVSDGQRDRVLAIGKEGDDPEKTLPGPPVSRPRCANLSRPRSRSDPHQLAPFQAVKGLQPLAIADPPPRRQAATGPRRERELRDQRGLDRTAATPAS